MHTSQQGYTLVEMVIASAIAAVLAAVAYPNFQGPLHKARRIDGISTLLQLQLGQEQWRSNHATYASLSELSASTSSPLGHYTITLADADAGGYTLQATAAGAQSADRNCRVLRVLMADGQVTRTSGTDARHTNEAAENRRCWGV